MKRLDSNFVLGFNQNFAKYCKIFAAKRQKNAKNRQKSYKNSYKIASKASCQAKLRAQTFVYESKIIRPAAIIALSFIFGFNVGKTFLPINRAEAAPLNIPEPAISIEATTKEEKSAPEKAEISTVTSGVAGSARAVSYASPAATSVAPADLSIPSIGISTSVVASNLSNSNLSVPAYGASKYNSLIMGHLFGVFSNLRNASAGQKIYLYGESYTIYAVERDLPVSGDRKSVGSYSMSNLIYRGSDLVLMTCAGSYNNALGTYSHRTLVFAKKD